MCVLTRPVKCSRSFAVRSKTSRDKSQNVSKRKSAHSMCARYFLSGRQCNGNLHFPHAIYTTWINFFSTIQVMPTDILLHVLTKNLQSIRDECRFQDFVAELDICDFDVCLCCETWRVELQDCIVTPSGCHIFLAGGDERKGVGIAVSKRLMRQMSEVTFHAYSSRICLLQFSVGNSKFSFISCYFPTSWDDDGEIEVMYDLLQLIVESARSTGSKIVVGGDFNACIGGLRVDEDAAGVGE